MKIELHTKTQDGKRWCHELEDGGTYDIRGDEVEIIVHTINGKRRKKETKPKTSEVH